MDSGGHLKSVIITSTEVNSIGSPKTGRPKEDTMADKDCLEKQIADEMERFNRGEITRDGAKEEIQALILAAETMRDL